MVVLTSLFYSDPVKQAQWRAYLRKGRVQGTIPTLDEVAEQIRSFLMPVVEALITGAEYNKTWYPGGPWAIG